VWGKARRGGKESCKRRRKVRRISRRWATRLTARKEIQKEWFDPVHGGGVEEKNGCNTRRVKKTTQGREGSVRLGCFNIKRRDPFSSESARLKKKTERRYAEKKDPHSHIGDPL